MILEGENAVSLNRKIMGATDPKKLKITRLESFMEYLLIKIQFMDLTLRIMLKRK